MKLNKGEYAGTNSCSNPRTIIMAKACWVPRKPTSLSEQQPRQV